MVAGLGSSPDPDVGQRTVQVLDVPENITDIVLLYLESAKYGGSDVEKFSYDEESRIYNATFFEQNGKVQEITLHQFSCLTALKYYRVVATLCECCASICYTL